MTTVAELVGVRKAYGATRALDGVDLRVGSGEILALLGPNGAGKTTAIRILLGLRRPDAGQARVFGRDPREPAARRRCGATPQETDLPDTLRVRELVEFVRAHYPEPLPAAEALERFGLGAFAHRQCGGLSGGQRRRLAVALAFVGNPELVFLDEPSSGLDADARRGLWESIRRDAERGRSIVLTTHDLVEAEALATRIVVLDHGCVRLDGAPDEIARRAGVQVIRLPSQRLPPLAGVDSVLPNGRHVALSTRDAAAVVRALVAAGADLDGIEITRPGLEQALRVKP